MSSVPTGTAMIRVEIGYNQMGTTTNPQGLVQPAMNVLVSTGSLTIKGLPWSTPLWFRISGLDSLSVPIWWSQGSVPDGNNGSVAIGNGGFQMATPPTPTLTPTGTSLQIQCSNGGYSPAWTVDGSTPSPTSSTTTKNGTGSTANLPSQPSAGVKARCTDGWAWGPVGSWTLLTSSNVPPPGTALPMILIQVSGVTLGQLTFSSSGGTSSEFTNLQAVVKTSNSSTPKLVALSTALNEPAGTKVTAYLVGWNNTNNSWEAGYVDTVTVGYASTLPSPSFKDIYGATLVNSWTKDTTSIALQIQTNQGTVQYTLDGVDPVPGNPDVSTWWSGQILQYPIGHDTLILKAIAVQGTQVSPPATLVIYRPAKLSWTRSDTGNIGCVSPSTNSNPGNQVLACGDGRGPLRWMGTAWIKADPMWNFGKVEVLYQSDTEILAAVGTQVYRKVSTGSSFLALGVPMANTVTGLTRYQGAVWASSADGIFAWNGTAWIRSVGGPGIVGTNGGAIWASSDNMNVVLWVGSVSGVWRYSGAVWYQSTNIASGTVSNFTTDPWNINGLLVASTSALQEFTQIAPTLTGSSISAAPYVLGQVVVSGTKVYAAFGDGVQGGVRVATSWSSGWSDPGIGWPQIAGSSPAEGVAVFTPLSGSKLLIASTPSGTWTLTLP